jgi:hypothetical protein
MKALERHYSGEGNQDSGEGNQAADEKTHRDAPFPVKPRLGISLNQRKAKTLTKFTLNELLKPRWGAGVERD